MDENCKSCSKFPTDKPFSRCSGCLTVRYCSTDCQKTDWPGHRRQCKSAKAQQQTKTIFIASTDEIKEEWSAYRKMLEPALCLAARSALGLGGAPNSIRKTHVLFINASRDDSPEEGIPVMKRYVGHSLAIVRLQDLMKAVEAEDHPNAASTRVRVQEMKRTLESSPDSPDQMTVGVVSMLTAPGGEYYWDCEQFDLFKLQPKEFMRLRTRFEDIPLNFDWKACLTWAIAGRDKPAHPKLLRYADELLSAAAAEQHPRSRNLVQRGFLTTLDEGWSPGGRHGDGKVVLMFGRDGLGPGYTQDLDTVAFNQTLIGILVEGVEWPARELSSEEEEALWANRSDSEEEEDLGPRWRVVRVKKQKKKSEKRGGA